jgi:AhpD family alkylhydroperoxidase
MESRLDFYKASPDAMKAKSGLERRIGKSGLEKALVELVRLRASQFNDCAYCADLHSSDARRAGESDRRLTALPVWREAPFFTDRERAALEWAEAVSLVAQSHVPDETRNQVRPHFTPEELVDLTLRVATISAWNRFAISFRKTPA